MSAIGWRTGRAPTDLPPSAVPVFRRAPIMKADARALRPILQEMFTAGKVLIGTSTTPAGAG